jgi:hypothetical protein
MAKSQMQIQKAALKSKAAAQSDKMHAACFGKPSDTTYMHHTPRHDQTGSPSGMANGGMVSCAACHGKGCGYCNGGRVKMADGGAVNPNFLPRAAAGGGAMAQAIAMHNAQIEAASNPQPVVAAPNFGAPPVNSGPPQTFVPGSPTTMNPVQLAEFNRLHNIPPKPGLLKTVFGYARGGMVRGPGTPTSDSIPANLSKGEYVLPADTVQAIGKDKLDQIKDATHTPTRSAHEAQMNGMAAGGMPAPLQGYANGGSPLTGFEARLARSGEPATGAASIMTPSSTKGAKAPKFGALLADGGLPTYPVEEIPTIEGAPAPEIPKVVGKAPPNAGMMADQAAAARTAAAPAADALSGTKNMFGRAAGSIGRGASAVANVAGRTYSAARAATGLAASPLVAGALLAMHSADAGAGSDVIRDANGNVLNKQAGSALSPEFSAMAPGDQQALIAERNDTNTDPRRRAMIDQTIRGMNPQPAIADPSTKYGAPSASFGVPSAQNAVPSTPAETEVAPGIARQGNSFAGVGANGPLDTSDGSPADVAAQQKIAGYKAELDADKRNVGVMSMMGDSARGVAGSSSGGPAVANTGAFGIAGMPSMPQFQISPEAERARAQIAQLSNKLTTLPPGTQGRRATMRSLAAQQGALAGLETQDTQRNAFAANQFGKAQELAMHRMSLGNQAVGYEVQRQGNALTFAAKKAELGNQQAMHGDSLQQERYKNFVGSMDDLAKTNGNPDLAPIYKTLAETENFPNGNGGTSKIWNLSGKSRAAAEGMLHTHALNFKTATDSGKVGTMSGNTTNNPAGVVGTVSHIARHPTDVVPAVFGGVNIGPTWSETRLNRDDKSAEATKARLGQATR